MVAGAANAEPGQCAPGFRNRVAPALAKADARHSRLSIQGGRGTAARLKRARDTSGAPVSAMPPIALLPSSTVPCPRLESGQGLISVVFPAAVGPDQPGVRPRGPQGSRSTALSGHRLDVTSRRPLQAWEVIEMPSPTANQRLIFRCSERL